jgi:hypothetical protein
VESAEELGGGKRTAFGQAFGGRFRLLEPFGLNFHYFRVPELIWVYDRSALEMESLHTQPFSPNWLAF